MKIKINTFLASTAADVLIYHSEKYTGSCTWESEQYYYCHLKRSAFPPCYPPLTGGGFLNSDYMEKNIFTPKYETWDIKHHCAS